MSPASEQVLCVKREDIFPDGAWHGFISDGLERHQKVIRESHFFMSRAAVEDDLSQLGLERVAVVNLRRMDLGPGVAAEMAVDSRGRLTGELSGVPPTGESRAQIISDYCSAENLRLEESVAYADSSSDLPMLEAAGFPH